MQTRRQSLIEVFSGIVVGYTIAILANRYILPRFGSTLIACEKRGRRAALIELDPKFVDVIIQRWQTFTNKAAIHKDTGLSFSEIQEQRRSK